VKVRILINVKKIDVSFIVNKIGGHISEAIENSEERQDINIICEYNCEVSITEHVLVKYLEN